MNSRNVQTFLMVSAAFFAMSAPVRSNSSARTLANAVAHTRQVAPVSLDSDRITLSGESDESRESDKDGQAS